MAKLLDRLRARRAERREAKRERAFQESRQGVPKRGSGAPRAGTSADSFFKGGSN